MLEALREALKSSSTYNWVTTWEEERFINNFVELIAIPSEIDIYLWSAYSGLSKVTGGKVLPLQPEETTQSVRAVEVFLGIEKSKKVLLMQDAHLGMGYPFPRMLRDKRLECEQKRARIVFISHALLHGEGGSQEGIDPTIEKIVNVFSYSLPTREIIRETVLRVLDKVRTQIPEDAQPKLKYTRTEMHECVKALQGLTEIEIRQAILGSIVALGKLDPQFLLKRKRQLIAKSDVLEYIEPSKSFSDIGGCDNLKKYFNRYRDQFSDEAIKFGIEPLRGVLKVGVPGCLSGETKIFDPIDKSNTSVKQRHEKGHFFHVYSRNQYGQKVVSIAYPPQKYPESKMITFTTEEGNSFTVTPQHRFLGQSGWIYASEVYEQLQQVEVYPLLSSEDTSPVVQREDVRHLKNKVQDFQIDYLKDYHSYDAQLQKVINNDLKFSPSQVDVHEYNQYDSLSYSQHKDVHPEHELKYNRFFQQYDHLSMKGFDDQNDQNNQLEIFSITEKFYSGKFQVNELSQTEIFPVHKEFLLKDDAHQSILPLCTSSARLTRCIRLVKAKETKSAEYFDFHVPIYNNYEFAGIWHHNCGKSLGAKAVATEWNLPLLRLDVGRVMSGIVGASESRMRQALAQASSMAPAIIWLDEVEKALSGTGSSNMTDGGTLSRVFGTLLTAMEEGMKDLIVLATANDISALPPELIRRFSEVFFFDLPTKNEREEIFRIHLNKRKRDPDKLDLHVLVDHTFNFTGSEIEKVVQDGIAYSWNEGKAELSTQHLLQAIEDTKPIARVMEDKITRTRDWARDRARYASSEAEAQQKPKELTAGEMGNITEIEDM